MILKGENKMRQKKKKGRFGYYLYAAVALLFAVANITIAVFLLTYVQNIRVGGNEFSTKKQIEAWIREDPYTINSVYTVAKFRIGKYQLPPYLEKVEVGFQKPWVLSVQVTEKEVLGCSLSGDTYVYFAQDGTVMKMGPDVLEGVPVVEGFRAEHYELYEPLEIQDEKTFHYICEISQEISDHELKPDRMVWETEGVSLYFDEVCVKLGKMNYAEKLTQLPPILEKLDGKKGTLHLEHYNDMSSSISFVQDTK